MNIHSLKSGSDSSAIKFAKVSVIGLGYVGLPAATMFARAGLEVIGVDVDKALVETINRGRTPIVEPDLEEALKVEIASGRLVARVQVEAADAFVIAVPTPFYHDGTYSPDLSYIEASARALAPVLKPGNLVVLESTSPVGTMRHIIDVIRHLRPDLRLPKDDQEGEVFFAYSPERVIPGNTMKEIVHNDRVIGGVTPQATKMAATLYGTFVRGECLLTDDKTAEMVKLAENTFRDVNIALANELSLICDRFDIDAWEMIDLANRHPRVSILAPGPGVGGHCISVDPWFIVSGAPDLTRLIKTAREVNDAKPVSVIRRVKEIMASRPNAKVACLGLSYKPDIDDFRESPALQITLKLSAFWPGRVVAVDPYREALVARDLRAGALTFMDYQAAITECEIIVALVGHEQFKAAPKPSKKVLVDTIGLWRKRT
jgi:UDP-N-acetyl-D-mannosaminuronic acid dehydrogenase